MKLSIHIGLVLLMGVAACQLDDSLPEVDSGAPGIDAAGGTVDASTVDAGVDDAGVVDAISYDATPPCGNGSIDPGEDCDPLLAVGTCYDHGFLDGTASCDSVTCQVLGCSNPTALVTWWQFEEEANDGTVAGNTGTGEYDGIVDPFTDNILGITQGEASVDSAHGNAICFESSVSDDDRVYIDQTPDVLTDEFTVEMWVNIESITTGFPAFFYKVGAV